MKYRNSEGYTDPTAGIAFAHIEYEERLQRRKEKKKHYDDAEMRECISRSHEWSSRKSSTSNHNQAPLGQAWPAMSAQANKQHGGA